MKARVDSLAVVALVIALATSGITMSLVTGNLAMALATGHVEAADRNACDLRLNVEPISEFPDARGAGALGSLLKDPLFPLTWACHTNSGRLVEVRGNGPVYLAGTR